jgi:hypothetical protein
VLFPCNLKAFFNKGLSGKFWLADGGLGLFSSVNLTW